MPKNNVHTGASYAGHVLDGDQWVAAFEALEVKPSPGTSSLASSPTSGRNSPPPPPSDPPPAPLTANRSEKDHAEPASTARSTGGNRRTAKRKGD